ncbi:hypothetical protein NSQ45_16670 [Caldifermentibacillus hisashii]|nr:hypothetical protein [Caldibacillus thermoamylovorans]
MLVETDIDMVSHIPVPWFIDCCIFDERREQLVVYVTFHVGTT